MKIIGFPKTFDESKFLFLFALNLPVRSALLSLTFVTFFFLEVV